jgi:SNF2 family DNA or RNA helicase
MAAQLHNSHDLPGIAWCNLNPEGDLLTKSIKGAVQVSGAESEEKKEDIFRRFITGDIRVLVTKPKIGGFGLNLQHCANMTVFPSHSYEQYYQMVRRCYRFGQKNKVIVDMITTKGQENVLKNLQGKEEKANEMFTQLVALMGNELKIEKHQSYTIKIGVPSWL